MRIAVTNHAVDRYIDRVEGAKGFERESVRDIVRKIVEDGFREGAVRPHPSEKDRRVIPFKSGGSILFLSIGPNTTTFKEADLAVISVLFEHEMTAGKVGLGIKVGDAVGAQEHTGVLLARKPPRFAVFVGEDPTIEVYRVKDEKELDELIKKRLSTVPPDESTPDFDIYELRKT